MQNARLSKKLIVCAGFLVFLERNDAQYRKNGSYE